MMMSLPASLDEALQARHDRPNALVLAGGTDLMVEINYGHRRPPSVISLRAVDELRGWKKVGDTLVLGSGLRYVDLINSELSILAPALAQAARTVGSPQIRNCGTIGGNVAMASPAGDTLPVLAALDAIVTVANLRGQREIPFSEFITGVKRTALADDELVTSITIPTACGPQEFLKVGKRNAMVIAVASVALVVDVSAKRVTCALGSVGPTIIRCPEAETMATENIDWDRVRIDNPSVHEGFGEMCAKAAVPIDDHRSSAAYRRHSISVMARRALARAF
jgi:CO/xanthine dehydrogenase FAD-binding subunit